MDIRGFFRPPVKKQKAEDETEPDVKKMSPTKVANKATCELFAAVSKNSPNDSKPVSSTSSAPSKSIHVPTPPAKKNTVKKKRIIDSDDDDDDFVDVMPKKEIPVPVRSSASLSSKSPIVVNQTISPKKPLKASSPLTKASSLPEAEVGPLVNLSFVFTGVMTTLGRTEAEDMVKALGARVASSVSGRTNYLVFGELLEDGRPFKSGLKYREAEEKKLEFEANERAGKTGSFKGKPKEVIQIIDELTFLALVKKHTPKPPPPTTTFTASSSSSSSSSLSSSSLSSTSSSSAFSGSSSSSSSSSSHMVSRLWVDVYAPKRPEHVLGNADAVKKVTDWLRRWNAVHIQKTSKPAYTKENPGAKAVLLSGPPGIGKTTLATVVAASEGFEVLELNASDVRSKGKLQLQLEGASCCGSMSLTGRVNKKRLIIMDEVDGMGGNEDRGGVQELIAVIKKSKVPFICICNDRQHTKIRSLAGHCFDLRIRRPTKQVLARRAVEIARGEGLALEMNAAELLAESCGNDMRQVLNCLQMWQHQSGGVKYLDMKNKLQAVEKDSVLRMTAFDGVQAILHPAMHDWNSRHEGFFRDYMLAPLLVQQNYIPALLNSHDRQDKVQRLSWAADAISDADLVDAVRGRDQNWSLLPVQASLTVRAGSHARGSAGFPGFPEWLGKNSTRNKRRRLLSELVFHIAEKVSGGPEAIRLSYISALRDTLLKLLNTTGPQATIDMLDEYGLSREDFFETLHELQLGGADVFGKMESKTKASFTRLYNSTVHKSQGLAALQTNSKKRKTTKDDTNEDLGEDEDDDGGVEDEVVESDDDDLSMFQAKKAKTSPKPTSAKSKNAKTSSTKNKGKSKK